MYFQKNAQASFGDMFDFDNSSNAVAKPIHKLNNVLIPPKDQDLRHMRYHASQAQDEQL